MSTDPPSDPLPIDPVEYETHEWLAEGDGLSSRAQVAAGSGVYQSTVPASIAAYAPALPSDLTADVEEASAALARFDAHTRGRLGTESPALGPMSSILLRTESASSSQIENLTVGARQLALAEIDQASSDNALTVAANVRAMEAALALADSLDEAAILRMHAELMAGERGWEAHAGRYRDGLVWVGTSAISPRGASHVAPQAPLVPALMKDLMGFVQREDLSVIVQAAVAHAQFETIHPFSDGNGRTGRALVHAVLRAKKLMLHTTAPVSAGLLTDTRAYFDSLTAYRAGDARPIVEQFARAARYAATSGAALVDDLAAELDAARDALAGLRPQAVAWRVLPHLISHPVLNSRYLVRDMGMTDTTAQRALQQLADRGVLEERSGKQRNRVWQHSGILRLLDAYAQQVRRG
ncbi:Fic family protein [Actinotalea sp. JY-7876]|uniref:Fic family protein n=1 Tax=Actinotalea sp. JY-7876 TaxID=2758442 RepID=UPI002714ED8C|nr:Fic family protein [Actinotalea sp. JY-7876]